MAAESTSAPSDDIRTISLEECRKHTTDKSCWLVVHGKVYDVTNFLEEHPGGYDIIVTATGADWQGHVHIIARPSGCTQCYA